MTAALQKGVLVSLTEANRPAPLTPRDCVVRGEYMPLYGDRLFTSTFMAKATAVEFRAGMRLWWEAWQQRPAASLPNEEKVLAHLAGFGSDLRGWRRVREMALHGFVLCSDGRWYHRMLADEAIKLWEKRRKERLRKHPPKGKGASEPAAASGEKPPAPEQDCGNPTGNVQASDSELTGNLHGNNVQNQELRHDPDADVPREEKGIDRDVSPNGDTAPPGGAPPLPDPRTMLFSAKGDGGLAIVMALTGKPEDPSRRFLGKLLKRSEDDAAFVLGVLREAVAYRPADAVGWISGCVKARYPDAEERPPQFDLATAQTPAAMFMAIQQRKARREA
jgi:hypothetical protein